MYDVAVGREDFELTNIWHELIVSATIGAAWLSALVAGPATGDSTCLSHKSAN